MKYFLSCLDLLSKEYTQDRNEQERRARLLQQALLNIKDWDSIKYTEHLFAPDTGEWLMDVILIPSQWHDSETGAPWAGEGPYEVVFTNSGTRCNCAWAQNNQNLTTGETVPCAHSILAAWIREVGLISPLHVGRAWPEQLPVEFHATKTVGGETVNYGVL